MFVPPQTTRRAWLTQQMAVLSATVLPRAVRRPRWQAPPSQITRVAHQALLEPVDPYAAIAHLALDAAKSLGASYAEVRLTRTVGHRYAYGVGVAIVDADAEVTGMGVRVLVDGAWGFAACPWRTRDHAIQLAHDAVTQARANAAVSAERVVFAPAQAATGQWATPIAIDPFQISIEEKLDFCHWVMETAARYHLFVDIWGGQLQFHRQERLCATSEGTLVAQVLYETGGYLSAHTPEIPGFTANTHPVSVHVHGLTAAGQGWELFLNADIEGQFARAVASPPPILRHLTVGRYHLVCDGATMAAMLDGTLGVATQLDRALGYEANADGTSPFDDPLAMLGHTVVAAPFVQVTANRSMPAQLATVRWDEEGVVPPPVTPLIQDGILVDFQTTREYATALAPYYQATGRPVRSNGCAGAEDALGMPLIMMPNLALEPNPAPVQLDDLIATVPKGILIEQGRVSDVDFQVRTGLLEGTMYEITNGRRGAELVDGSVAFDTLDFWKHVTALGSTATRGSVVFPRPDSLAGNGGFIDGFRGWYGKGQPSQTTSHTVTAVAATVLNQPVINASRRA